MFIGNFYRADFFAVPTTSLLSHIIATCGLFVSAVKEINLIEKLFNEIFHFSLSKLALKSTRNLIRGFLRFEKGSKSTHSLQKGHPNCTTKQSKAYLRERVSLQARYESTNSSVALDYKPVAISLQLGNPLYI